MTIPLYMLSLYINYSYCVMVMIKMYLQTILWISFNVFNIFNI